MSTQRPMIFPDDEEPGQKLMRKSKESPFMVAGKIENLFSQKYEKLRT